MAIVLPAVATVFTLRGAGAPLNALNGWCRGVFDHYPVHALNYPANMASNSISTGVTMIDQAVRATPGAIILVGHSQGSQAISVWMEKYKNDPTVSRDITCVLTGNPVRNPTGQLVGGFVVGGGLGVATPNDTPWVVYDVARAGDTWAIKVGNWFTGWWGKLFVHPYYTGVDLYAPGNVITRNGNLTLVTTA